MKFDGPPDSWYEPDCDDYDYDDYDVDDDDLYEYVLWHSNDFKDIIKEVFKSVFLNDSGELLSSIECYRDDYIAELIEEEERQIGEEIAYEKKCEYYERDY